MRKANNTSFKPGHKQSDEARKKMSLAKKGKTPWNKGLKGVMCAWNKGLKGAQVAWNKGKRGQISKTRGEKSHFWKGGVTPINIAIRMSAEYKRWRKAVYERDGYKCLSCGKVGGQLNADHIKPFSVFPELRFDVDNGRTLCVPCHRKTETFGVGAWRKQYSASLATGTEA